MILHIFKNDLLYLRRWLFVWFGFLALIPCLLLGLRMPFGWDVGYWDFLQYGIMLGFLIQALFQMLLIIKCVQKENLQSARSYWLTRPIRPGHLMAAKLLFWIFISALPQVIQCAIIGAIFPGGWSGALNGMESILIVALLLGFGSIMAGSVTKDAGQGILAIFGAPFALMLLGFVIVLVLGVIMPVERLFYSFTAIPYLSDVLVGFGLLVSVAAYWWQMHHPSNRWRYRGVCAGVLALVLIAGKIPAPVSVPVPESTMTLPEGAELEVGRLMFTRTDRPFPGSRSQDVEETMQLWREGATGSDYGLKALCQWNGLPDGWLTQIESVRSYDSEGRWLRPRAERRLSSHNQAAYEDDYLRTLFPDAEAVNRVQYRGSYEPLFSSPLVQVDKVEPTDEFTTIVATRFYSPEKVRLPLGAEAKIDLGETRLRLRAVDQQSKNLVLEFNFIGIGELGQELGRNLDRGFLVLRDPTTGRVVMGRRGRGNASTAMGLLTAGVFEVSFQDMALAGDSLAGLELYHVKQNLVGTYVGPIRYTLSND